MSEEDRVGPLGLLFDRQLSIDAILSLLERKPSFEQTRDLDLSGCKQRDDVSKMGLKIIFKKKGNLHHEQGVFTLVDL